MQQRNLTPIAANRCRLRIWRGCAEDDGWKSRFAAGRSRPSGQGSSQSNADTWYQSVISQVETAGRNEFRITRLDQDPTGSAATVETALVARLAPAKWQIVWSNVQTIRVDEISVEAEKQLPKNPQVKSVLSMLSSLGVAAETEVKKAIRFGAATQAAQKLADRNYAEFRDTFVQRLDGPPL